jgi:enoyl-CoA hydratase
MLDRKRALSPEENKKRMLDFYSSFLGIRELGVPIIAAINGAAIGAGLCLAAACDIRIAVADAKLGVTFVKLGLHPGMGASYFFPRTLPASFANEFLLTGKIIQAEEALRLGFLSRVAAAENLRELAQGMGEEILAAGPLAGRQLLETLRGSDAGLQQALEREATCQAENYASSEFAEGILAIREKRSPNFYSDPQK